MCGTLKGQTELELAQSILGADAYQQRVNGDCRLLLNRGQVERRGKGAGMTPFGTMPCRPKLNPTATLPEATTDALVHRTSRN